MVKKHDDQDEDLKDLLDGTKRGNEETEPLNLDQLKEGNLDVPVKRSSPPIFQLCCAYLAYMCEYAPRCCLCLACLGVIIPLFFIIQAAFNPTETYGVISHDYSDILSKYDLDIGKIDHWCIKGDNDSCRCEDPLEPSPNTDFRSWSKGHTVNQKTVEEIVEKGTHIDIAFLGESVVEEMDGHIDRRDAANAQSNKLSKLFQKNFSKANGAKLEGVALGIAGDTVCCSFLLC
jgi:hypothetical protein